MKPIQEQVVLGIDPGTERSAFVRYHRSRRIVLCSATWENAQVLKWVRDDAPRDGIVIEMVASYGKPVGAEVFETVLWIGRFAEACGGRATLIYRRDVKMHLCGSVTKVTDAVIRQRLIDIFGPGREAAIGKKAAPGPLFQVHGDEWQALAVALTAAEIGAHDLERSKP